MVSHHKIHVARDAHGAVIAQILVLRRNIRFSERLAIHINDAAANLNHLIRQRDDTLDERLAPVQRIPKDHDVAPLNRLESVDKLIDEDTLLVRKQRRHAGAFDFDRLIKKHNDDKRQTDGNEKVARPDTNLALKGLPGSRFGFRSNWRLFRDCSGRLGGGRKHFLVRTQHFSCLTVIARERCTAPDWSLTAADETGRLLDAVVVEKVKLFGHTERETGARIVLVDAADAGEVPGESTSGDLQTETSLTGALRADQRVVNTTGGVKSVYFADQVHAPVNRVTEARAVHENVVLRKKRIGRLKDFNSEIAHEP